MLHGLEHFSPSSLNLWAAEIDDAQFWAPEPEKIYGQEDKTIVRVWRAGEGP